jgi:anaerobic magnesium-protoporphyrin IX monomethyl ester cyclase
MRPWRTLLWFKFIEMVMQARPRALYRVLLHPDLGLRHAMRWYTQMGRRVWPYEIRNFFRDPLRKDGPTVVAFWGAAQDAEETSMAVQSSQMADPSPAERPPPAVIACASHASR